MDHLVTGPDSGFNPIKIDARVSKRTRKSSERALQVKGQKFDGQVPMTPFAGMLKDDEVAAVLTFVRNHFSNKAGPITAEQVKAVRGANPGRTSFYIVEELLKQHPMKK